MSSVKRRIQSSFQYLAAFIAIAAVLAGLSANQVHAADATANTLKVSPVRSDIEVKPGESTIVRATVTNLTNNEVTVSPTIHDFVAGDESGTPALILDANQYAPTHSLKRFITPLKNITIPAKQARTVNVIVSVPAGTQAGGYFGAVRFAPATPDGGGQVNLNPSVASLILLTVPGNFVEKLQLTDFAVQHDGKTGDSFTTTDGLQATLRFENKGNVQVGPFGKISVKKGDKVVFQTDFNNNNPREVILPDSARRWDVPLQIKKPAGITDLWGFGEYTVYATLTYGKTNQSYDVSKSFWVVPTEFIIMLVVVALLLVAIGIGIWLFVRNRRRRQVIKHLRGNK